MRGKQAKKQKVIVIILTLIMICFFVAPVALAVVTAFKTKLETANSVFTLPSSFYLENFKEAIKKSGFLLALRNSCIITFPSVALIVVFSAMGGYSIARNGKDNKLIAALDKVYLSSLMIPFQILMIPVYRMFKDLKLQNNLFGMILMLTGYSIAYATFLFVGFVKSIPRELEESARVDGCGPYRTFFLIVFPLMKPIIATVSALHIMWLWNDFNISLILLQKDAVRPLTVKQYYFFGEFTADYGVAFAAAILSMIPVIICFMLMQKYIVEGISDGAVKS